ncbi:hypothetical protein JG687_00011453 [Phytophthora cactorum]|uniref:Uncharacterized protein n=1 Tax=Phytophthora cactorum TaxID=29920 RepID=A0A8T1U9Q1_9STRA|nr:hypothetical protein JG687_00011453 [Phytophthora cactorum]
MESAVSLVANSSSSYIELRQKLSVKHEKYVESLRKISDRCRTETENNLRAMAERGGVPMPTTWSDEGDVSMANVNFLSQLAVVSGLTLPVFVRLVRGQTGDDPRPNKDLFE